MPSPEILSALSPEALVAYALAHRPDYNALRWQCKEAKARLSALRAESIPWLTSVRGAYAEQGRYGKTISRLADLGRRGLQRAGASHDLRRGH